MLQQFTVTVSCRVSSYSTLTALMMLVCPDPGIQPVTTITMSPVLKNPRALPGGRVRRGVRRGAPSHTNTNNNISWTLETGTRRHTHTQTYVHAKVDPVVDVVGPDRGGQRMEESREHPPEQLGLTGHLEKEEFNLFLNQGHRRTS